MSPNYIPQSRAATEYGFTSSSGTEILKLLRPRKRDEIPICVHMSGKLASIQQQITASGNTTKGHVWQLTVSWELSPYL